MRDLRRKKWRMSQANALPSIEPLETRAMMAAVGPESWGAAGPAISPIAIGADSFSGAILTCSSPSSGSSSASLLPSAATGSGGSPSGAWLWLPSTSGTDTGFSAAGSSGGVDTNGPALSSQSPGVRVAGGPSVSADADSSASNDGDPWLSCSAGSGAVSLAPGSSGRVNTGGQAMSSQYTGGSDGELGANMNAGTSWPSSGADLWLAYGACAATGASTSGSTNGVNLNGPALSAQYTNCSGGGQATPSAATGSVGLLFGLYDATQTTADGAGSQSGSTGSTTLEFADAQSSAELTPLVYQPGSEGGPVFVTTVWTGDDGEWHVVQVTDVQNQEVGAKGALQGESDPPARSWLGRWWGWFIGDDPIKGSLWKLGPADVPRVGDHPTVNNGKTAVESLEDGGKYTKELINGATRDTTLAVAGAVIGFAAGAADDAVRNVGRVDHAGEHLWEAGVLVGTRGSTPFRDAVRSAAVRILQNPRSTFDHVIGGQPVKGFYGVIDGKPVVFFVAKEAKGKIGVGEIVTAFVPSPQQMKNWGIQ